MCGCWNKTQIIKHFCRRGQTSHTSSKIQYKPQDNRTLHLYWKNVYFPFATSIYNNYYYYKICIAHKFKHARVGGAVRLSRWPRDVAYVDGRSGGRHGRQAAGTDRRRAQTSCGRRRRETGRHDAWLTAGAQATIELSEIVACYSKFSLISLF